MKKNVFIIIGAIFSLHIFAQTSGGQIKRNKGVSLKNNNSSISHNHNIRDNKQKQIIMNLIRNMVVVDGGSFTMGATKEQGIFTYESEKPLHKVTLNSFKIGKFEVSQEEWTTVMGNNPSCNKSPKCPVENVSWIDCQIFIKKLNDLTGLNFRLPTEAEWEYAARGGMKSTGNMYSGYFALSVVGWFDMNSNKKTGIIGTKEPNELGLYDMSGNVWEWCHDWFESYSNGNQVNPHGPKNGKERIIRGGSYCSESNMCRVSIRSSFAPDEKDDDLGIRLACNIK